MPGLKKKQICYKCGAPSSTIEHVPPKCLFPESKDVDGLYRNELITVPSCIEHNLGKSSDDEFLMISLSGIAGNNHVGYNHMATKVRRALNRKADDYFVKAIIRESRPHEFIAKSGRKFPLLIGMPDIDRLNRCFEQIACGLYFHEFQKSFNGECRSFIGFLKYHDDMGKKLLIFIREQFIIESKGAEVKGKNPLVFTYCFLPPDNNGLITLKMTFFEGTHIYVAMKSKELPEPFDLTMMLMSSGIETTLHLENGKTIKFNESISSP